LAVIAVSRTASDLMDRPGTDPDTGSKVWVWIAGSK